MGLIPAAGIGSRLGHLPFSKELFPIGMKRKGTSSEMKVACHYTMEMMKEASIEKVFIILRNGKWDIPSYFGNGEKVGLNLGYLIMGIPNGVPFTLDVAYPFVRDKIVALGFPDIIIIGKNIYSKILNELSCSEADVMLGIHEVENPQKWDMVRMDREFNVLEINIKPLSTTLRYAWVVAVWRAAFTDFMHNYIMKYVNHGTELFVGHVLQAALEQGFKIKGACLEASLCIDIGTSDDLYRFFKD